MKFAFFGSPEFATVVLKQTIEAGFIPSALICNPDRPVGRKHVITPPMTKQLIVDLKLEDKVKIFQPEKPSLIASELQSLELDFFVVTAYAKIIPNSVLQIPKLGTIGVHPSLLPKYRGASPIQSALLAGESTSGVALYLLGPGVDDGPVFTEKEIPVDITDDYFSLENKLALLGGEMLSALIPQFIDGKIEAVPQDDSKATLTRKFMTEDGFIDAGDISTALKNDAKLGEMLHNKIRALSAEPDVWTLKDEKRIKILESKLEDGSFRIVRIQKEGKTPEVYRGELDQS